MSSSASSPPSRLISDELWALAEPLIPPRKTAVHGRTGRPRTSDRDVLEGIAFVLSTRHRLGQAAGRARLRLGVDMLAAAARVGRGRRVRPAARRRAQPARRARRAGLVAGVSGLGQRPREKGGELTGPNPTDRAKRGSKYHLLVDARGLPLNVAVSGANRHDSMLVEPILDAMPAIRRGGRGHPRRRPVKLHADKGYDVPRVRRYLRRRGITARIARIGRDSSARLGRHRWVVERTIGWLLSYKRLALRYDRTAATITALVRLAVTLICARRLPRD